MKILVVEDHALTREGIVYLLKSQRQEDDFFQAENFRSALETIEKQKPDLVITDMSLPDKSGLELIRDGLAISPRILFLVISMHDEAIYAERVLKAGGKGYLMKNAPSDQLLEAVRNVERGGVYVSPCLAAHLLTGGKSGSRTQKMQPISVLNSLSDRELRVLELIGRALTNQAVAEKLGISPRTVDAHKTHIKTKLGLPDNNALLKFAIQWLETETKV